jgi:hypothetical protein
MQTGRIVSKGKSKGQNVDHLVKQLLSQQPNSKIYLDRLNAKMTGKGSFGAFAPIHGTCCAACNLSIPTSQLQRVITGEIINCPTCSRFLYSESGQAA